MLSTVLIAFGAAIVVHILTDRGYELREKEIALRFSQQDEIIAKNLSEIRALRAKLAKLSKEEAY